jgi:phosphatidylinositol kinase/protein kinase (PI-3  family)
LQVKSRDDLRLEGVVMQALRLCEAAWQQHRVHVYVRPYSIVCCGDQCGVSGAR